MTDTDQNRCACERAGQAPIYRTASGARVELLSPKGDCYRVRYVDTGAVRTIPKEAVHTAVGEGQGVLMAGRRIHVVMDAGLVERIDAARGEVPRGAWIRRRLEEALGSSTEGSATSSLSGAARPGSAPPRTAAPKDYVLPKIAPRKP